VDYFKNACRIHTSFAIARYLMSNAGGRPNGAEKALRHRELCQFYVAAVHGVADPELVHREHDAIYQAVHTATQELTDYLDEVIGFPVEERPDYDKLEPLFFEHFHRLAMTALASNAK
jgi:hypothetical protein